MAIGKLRAKSLLIQVESTLKEEKYD